MKLWILGSLGIMLGCGDGAAEETTGGCADNSECASGQACVESACADVQCLSSADCALGSTCSADSLACEPGCGDATDCFAGETCLAGECVAETCMETNIDCGLGEVCLDGACQPFDGLFCSPCDPADESPCGDEGKCWWFQKQAAGYCLPYCSPTPGAECPGGSTCTGNASLGNAECFAMCADLVDGGYL